MTTDVQKYHSSLTREAKKLRPLLKRVEQRRAQLVASPRVVAQLMASPRVAAAAAFAAFANDCARKVVLA